MILAGLESLVASKDETIARLEGQVHELTARIKEMKQTHKIELQEAKVRAEQELYIAKNSASTSTRREYGTRSNSQLRATTKPKIN